MKELKYKYEVEMYKPKTKSWITEYRWYNTKQNISDFKDNEYRKNFKAI
jgi:hypothetical protein